MATELDTKPEEDPTLFTATLSSGRIAFQYQNVQCAIALRQKNSKEIDLDTVVTAMRNNARPVDASSDPLAVENARPEELVAAFNRATERMTAQGNSCGSLPASPTSTAAGSQASTPSQ